MIRRFLLLCCLLQAAVAGAQILDEVLVARDGPSDAVITIKFALRVQYLRSVSSPKQDLVQVYFRVVQPEEEGRTVEEFRRPPTQGLVPGFTVTYPAIQPRDTRRLDIQFERPVTVRVRSGPDNRAILVVTPALAPAKPAAAAPPAAKPGTPTAAPVAPATAPAATAPAPEGQAPSPEFVAQAAGLLAQSRAALDGGRVDEAIDRLNELLNLPPNPSSREAQELIGFAREKRGEPEKARIEYDLFLRLYPEGVDSQRVRARLVALGYEAPPAPVAGAVPAAPGAPVAPPPPAPPAQAKPGRFLTWGSVSQYYYGGQSRTDSTITTVTPATNATTIDTLSLTSTDQKSIVTNLDLNARYASATWDDRVVVRGTDTYSLLKGQPNRDRLVAAYTEISYLPSQSTVRLGRQTSTFGGVLGRFDGVQATSAGIIPRLRANVVVGRPVDRYDGTTPLFYGASVDADAIRDNLGGSFYAIQQRVQGYTDRTAVGTELRYFDTDRSLITLLDYDVSFRAINIAMAQGSWQLPGGSSVNFLGDYRRTPSLQLSNALLAGRNLTLEQYLETFGEAQTRDDARAVTPISKVLYVGFTTPLSPRWQVGADVRFSSLSGTPEIGLLPATMSTGNVITYSAQAIGTGIFGRNDVLVANASYLTGTLNKAFSIGLTERFPFGASFVLEPSLRYYRQKGENDVKIDRYSPGIKLSYRLRERMQLEGEATWEHTHTVSPTVDDTTTRIYYFVGYRWDF